MHNGLQSSHFVQGKLDVQSTMVLRVSHFVPRKLDVRSIKYPKDQEDKYILFFHFSWHFTSFTCEFFDMWITISFHISFKFPCVKIQRVNSWNKPGQLAKETKTNTLSSDLLHPQRFHYWIRDSYGHTVCLCTPMSWRTCSFDSFTVHFTTFILW